MTQPTGTTPLTPGEQLLNPDIEHIEIPQQQQQPETWTVWVETYVNARIQHEVVPLREEILLLRDRVLALETQPAVASGPCPSVFRQTRLRSSMDPASLVKPSPTHARLYLQLQSGTTTSAETKIGWILSFMTSGRARTWRDSAIAHHAATGSYVWISVEAFMDAFRDEFYPVAEAEAAMVKLENSEYFQRSGESVDAYVDRFRALVKKAKLGDKGAVVIKFRRGLAKSLHTTLSDSPSPPSISDVDDWIERSRALEYSRVTQRAITGTTHATPVAPPRPSGFQSHRPPPPPPPFASRPPAPPGISMVPRIFPPPPPPSSVTPMELDAARNRARNVPSDVCRRCKQPGHWAKDCTTPV